LNRLKSNGVFENSPWTSNVLAIRCYVRVKMSKMRIRHGFGLACRKSIVIKQVLRSFNPYRKVVLQAGVFVNYGNHAKSFRK
jgi:hypothetical protein